MQSLELSGVIETVSAQHRKGVVAIVTSAGLTRLIESPVVGYSGTKLIDVFVTEHDEH